MSGYTVGEIVVWLLLAAVMGLALGWLLRELKYRSEHVAAVAPSRMDGPDAPTPTEPSPFARPTVIESAGHANSARPLAGGKAPSPQHVVKANTDSMTYHVPGSPGYGPTIAELWFTSEADAVAAGFRHARPLGTPAKKAPAKKAPAKKAPAKSAVTKKAPAKKAPAKKAPAKSAVTKKAPPSRAVAKRATAKNPVVKKAPAKRASTIAPGRLTASGEPLSGGEPPSGDLPRA